MYEDCDNCQFYDVGDTCDECRKRRKRHRNYDPDCEDDADFESYDDCGDGYFNEYD